MSEQDKESIEVLRAQRDQLLAALEWVATHVYGGGKCFAEVEPVKSALAAARA